MKSLLGSHMGRQIMADALASAAIVAANADRVKHAGGVVARGTKKSGKVIKDAVKSAANAITDVIAAMLRNPQSEA